MADTPNTMAKVYLASKWGQWFLADANGKIFFGFGTTAPFGPRKLDGWKPTLRVVAPMEKQT